MDVAYVNEIPAGGITAGIAVLPTLYPTAGGQRPRVSCRPTAPVDVLSRPGDPVKKGAVVQTVLQWWNRDRGPRAVEKPWDHGTKKHVKAAFCGVHTLRRAPLGVSEQASLLGAFVTLTSSIATII